MTQARLAHDHIVAFYDRDDDLVPQVGRFLHEGLRTGESVIVIATQAHRDQLADHLEGLGMDASARKRVHALDAASLLSRLMVEGALDHDRFVREVAAYVGDVVSGATAVRAFGEMVGLLWTDGYVTAALELESYWNELARDIPFRLLCGYHLEGFAEHPDLTAVTKVCASHTATIAPPRCLPVDAPDARERVQVIVPSPFAASAARSFVVDALADWGDGDLVRDSTIVVSELAANAVRHAGSAFRLTVRRDRAALRICVEDSSPAAPRMRTGSLSGDGGLGLGMIERLCSDWGFEPRSGGKAIWAELTAPARDS